MAIKYHIYFPQTQSDYNSTKWVKVGRKELILIAFIEDK